VFDEKIISSQILTFFNLLAFIGDKLILTHTLLAIPSSLRSWLKLIKLIKLIYSPWKKPVTFKELVCWCVCWHQTAS